MTNGELLVSELSKRGSVLKDKKINECTVEDLADIIKKIQTALF